MKRKEDQVTRIVSATTEAGHNSALLAKLSQLQDEVRDLISEVEAVEAAAPPAPLAITENIDAMIQAASQSIERAISHPDGWDG